MNRRLFLDLLDGVEDVYCVLLKTPNGLVLKSIEENHLDSFLSNHVLIDNSGLVQIYKEK